MWGNVGFAGLLGLGVLFEREEILFGRVEGRRG